MPEWPDKFEYGGCRFHKFGGRGYLWHVRVEIAHDWLWLDPSGTYGIGADPKDARLAARNGPRASREDARDAACAHVLAEDCARRLGAAA